MTIKEFYICADLSDTFICDSKLLATDPACEAFLLKAICNEYPP